ncbi:hypothetical protein ACJX0J_035955, partial [Zea mays]
SHVFDSFFSRKILKDCQHSLLFSKFFGGSIGSPDSGKKESRFRFQLIYLDAHMFTSTYTCKSGLYLNVDCYVAFSCLPVKREQISFAKNPLTNLMLYLPEADINQCVGVPSIHVLFEHVINIILPSVSLFKKGWFAFNIDVLLMCWQFLFFIWKRIYAIIV